MQRLLIIGHGYAGRRFVKALQFLETVYPGSFTVVGVVDRNPAVITSLPSGWSAFHNLDHAYAETVPTAVAVAVNEYEHANVLKGLPNSVPTVLCEKPLTHSLTSALDLESELQQRQLSLNFVERHSPILASFAAWYNQHPEVHLVRAEFFWGKNRIADARSTMGVLSELSHPIDLIDFIVGFEECTVLAASGMVSDFAPSSPHSLDSADIILRTEHYLIVGHSSFVWAHRSRSIILLFSHPDGYLYQAVFEFDIPLWDCDTLKITHIDFGKSGNKTVVHTHSVTNTDFPPELHQTYKVSEFFRKSLLLGSNSGVYPEHVDYKQAVKIQRVLANIEGALAARAATYETVFWPTPAQGMVMKNPWYQKPSRVPRNEQ